MNTEPLAAPRAEPFMGLGWRRREQHGCFTEQARSRPDLGSAFAFGGTYILVLRCERPRGHKGWHGCDNGCWE